MRFKKALFNILISLSYQITLMICGLITPRLILTTFGSEYNGVVSSITKFLSMISVLNLGVAGATRVALYHTLANNDNKGTSGIVRATEMFMRKNATIFAFYAVTLAFVYPLISNNGISNVGIMLLVVIIGIGTFAKYFFGYSYKCLLDADQRVYIYNLLQTVATIANTLIAFVLIKSGATIYVVYLGSSICFALVPIFMNFYVGHKYRINRKISPNNKALNQRNAVMLHSIANIVHENVDLVVLTLFTTAKNISVYTIYYAVVGNIRQVMRSFTNGLEAAFGNMWAKKEYDNLKRTFSTYEFLMYCFTSVVFSCTGVLIVPFIMIYTKGVTDTNYSRLTFAIVVTICEGIYCIREPYLTMVQAAGKYKETRKYAITEAAINVILSFILVWRFNIVGVVFATIIANLYRTLSYALYIARNILHFRFRKVLFRMLWMTANVCIIVKLANKVYDFNKINSWENWIHNGIGCFFLATLVTILMGFCFYRIDLFNGWKYAKKMLNRIDDRKHCG